MLIASRIPRLPKYLRVPGGNVTLTGHRRRKQSGKREAQLENLPVETIEYTLPPEEQICGCCEGHLHEMSTEVRQEIKVIPAQVSVTKHVRHVYACRQCEREGFEDGPFTPFGLQLYTADEPYSLLSSQIVIFILAFQVTLLCK